jgi:hypothetical protein
MKTHFDDTIDRIMQRKETGLLSLIISDQKQHFKIYFADGSICRMVYGVLRDAGCLMAVDRLQINDCFFAKGITLPATEVSSFSTTDIIQRLKLADKTKVSSLSDKPINGAKDLSSVLEKLRMAFIRQVGPVGDIVFAQVLEKWNPPASPTTQQLLELVGRISEKIEEDNRKEFQQEAGNVIS